MPDSDHDLLIRLQEQVESLRRFMVTAIKNLEERIEDRHKHTVPIEEFIQMKTQVSENTAMRKFIYASMGASVVALIGAVVAIVVWASTL